MTNDSGAAIVQADVFATRAPDRLQMSATSGADGAFAIVFPNGTGDYLLNVAAVGYTAYHQRVVRTGSDSVITVNVRLERVGTVHQLARVVTTAAKPKPDRSQPGGVDVGGAEALPGSFRRVAPDLAGDLAAIAGMAPGVLSTPAGISVLGLNPAQNSVTLNGMALGNGVIPRDVASRVRVSTATYDPANGWFSGARTNVQLGPANEVFQRGTSHFTLDAPALQANDRVSSLLGQRFTNFNASVGGVGVMLDDRFSYNYGLQGYRKSADITSVVSADPVLLQRAGIAADSAYRFLNLLRDAAIPVGVSGIPSSATTDNLIFLGRFDHAPYDWKTLQAARTTWGLTSYTSLTKNDAQGMQPQGTPSHSGATSQDIAGLQAQYSTYFANDWLADVRSGVTYTHNTGTPYLTLPDGRVLVSSDFPDGTGGVSSLQFGGNSGLQNDARNWTWESMGELQLYPAAYARHRVKLSGDVRLDGSAADQLSNRNGTFAYNSLADLAANQPASFSRTLNAPTRHAGAWNSFVSIGDLWRAAPTLQVLYGARIEGNAFLDLPASNPSVSAAFGQRTDNAPNSIAVLPRFGLTWNIPRTPSYPGGSVRLGIGEFRNLLDPSLLSSASVQTGLPSGLSRISCIGSAVPTPDWNAWSANPASIPSQCVGGSGTTFADASPNVQLYDRGFQPSASWRGNLSWSSSLWARTNYTVEGIYSYNVNQPDALDLNFSSVPRGILAGEGRTMFVTPASIVPSTGAVSPVEARTTDQFGRVNFGVSDLRSTSSQLQFILRPDLVNASLTRRVRDPMIAYVYSDSRAQYRGFNGSTFGDPAERLWSRGDLSARHQFTAQAIFWPWGDQPGPGFFFYAHLRSGLPFTPVVGSDVNGDGLANDRAFIYDPARVPDAALAAGLRSLASSPSDEVRRCITSQLGRAADRNSCEGSWSAALNMNVVMSAAPVLGNRFDRFNFAFNFTNPLGGLDQLLHGSSNLRGWGTASAPDPVLYSVRGYDATANRFMYEVNPRFGSTAPSLNTIRAPFRLTLDVTMDISPSFPQQQVSRWMTPGRRGHPGPRLTTDELVNRLRRTVPDPYTTLLGEQSDSLLLTNDQVMRIRELAAARTVTMDSIFFAVSAWMANLPDSFDESVVVKRSDDAQLAAMELTRLEVREKLPRILVPEQLALLSGITRFYYNATQPVSERFFIP